MVGPDRGRLVRAARDEHPGKTRQRSHEPHQSNIGAEIIARRRRHAARRLRNLIRALGFLRGTQAREQLRPRKDETRLDAATWTISVCVVRSYVDRLEWSSSLIGVTN
jgi:hypothetical protein